MPEGCSKHYSVVYTVESSIRRRIPSECLYSEPPDNWFEYGFTNSAEAEAILEACTHPAAKCALLILHEGILDCMGLPREPWSIPRRRTPTWPLDLAWFYRSVIDMMKTWDTQYSHMSLYSGSTYELIQDPDLPRLTRQKEDNLCVFILKLGNLSECSKIDIGYCTWLFAETILVENLLPQILTGKVERHFFETHIDMTEWYKGWES